MSDVLTVLKGLSLVSIKMYFAIKNNDLQDTLANVCTFIYALPAHVKVHTIFFSPNIEL